MLQINQAARIINAVQPHTAVDFHGAVPPIAYRLGVLDAKLAELCVPEMYFRNPQEKLQYTMGYESVKGRTLLSDDTMGRH